LEKLVVGEAKVPSKTDGKFRSPEKTEDMYGGGIPFATASFARFCRHWIHPPVLAFLHEGISRSSYEGMIGDRSY